MAEIRVSDCCQSEVLQTSGSGSINGWKTTSGFHSIRCCLCGHECKLTTIIVDPNSYVPILKGASHG